MNKPITVFLISISFLIASCSNDAQPDVYAACSTSKEKFNVKFDNQEEYCACLAKGIKEDLRYYEDENGKPDQIHNIVSRILVARFEGKEAIKALEKALKKEVGGDLSSDSFLASAVHNKSKNTCKKRN